MATLQVSRSVITAHLPQYAPHTDSPPTDFLGSLDTDVSHARVLLLGSDPWHILASLAAAGARPHLHAVDVAFVDKEPVAVARAALLLLLASELDPKSDADMAFLWHVWNNAVWPKGTWPRLERFVERLRCNQVPWLQFGSSKSRETVASVYRVWLGMENKWSLTANQLIQQRYSALAQWAKPRAASQDAQEYDPVQQYIQMVEAWRDEITHRAESLEDLEEEVDTAVKMSLSNWNAYGCIWPFKNLVEVNMTLLDKDWMYGCGGFASHPAQRWQPFTCKELSSACSASNSKDILATACITKMRQLVAAFQQHTSFTTTTTASGQRQGRKVSLRVFLHCTDPLQFCCETVTALGGGDSGEGAATVFHVIETGSLCDRVGLLPLLVSATPRLAQTRGSRIRTEVRAWGFVTDNIKDYMCKYALGLPVQLFPTMLGLRLVTDIEHGSQGYFRCSDTQYNERTRPWLLEWAPAAAMTGAGAPTPKPTIRMSSVFPALATVMPADGQDSLHMALRSVLAVCCRTDFRSPPYKEHRAPLKMPTPATLALLLAQLAHRVDACADSMPSQAQPDPLKLLTETVAQWVPKHMVTELLGAITICMASANSKEDPTRTIPLVRVSDTVSVAPPWNTMHPLLPQVRVVVMPWELVQSSRAREQALAWVTGCEAVPGACLVLDSAHVQLDSSSGGVHVSVVLSTSQRQMFANHGIVCLDLISEAWVTEPFRISHATSTPVQVNANLARCCYPTLRVPSQGMAAEPPSKPPAHTKQGKGQEAQRRDEIVIERVYEGAEGYRVLLKVEGMVKWDKSAVLDLVVRAGPAPRPTHPATLGPPGSTHVVYLSFPSCPTVRPAEIVLPWPVNVRYGDAELTDDTAATKIRKINYCAFEVLLTKAEASNNQWPMSPPVPSIILDSLPKISKVQPYQLRLDLPPAITDAEVTSRLSDWQCFQRILLMLSTRVAQSNILGHMVFTSEADVQARQPAFIIRTCSPFLQHPDRRPLLPIIVFVHRYAHKMGLSADIRHAHAMVPDTCQIHMLAESQAPLLLGLLRGNAELCHPTAAQQALLPCSMTDANRRAWIATYLTPILAEHPSGYCIPDRLTDTIMKALGKAATPAATRAPNLTPEEQERHQCLFGDTTTPRLVKSGKPKPAKPNTTHATAKTASSSSGAGTQQSNGQQAGTAAKAKAEKPDLAAERRALLAGRKDLPDEATLQDLGLTGDSTAGLLFQAAVPLSKLTVANVRTATEFVVGDLKTMAETGRVQALVLASQVVGTSYLVDSVEVQAQVACVLAVTEYILTSMNWELGQEAVEEVMTTVCAAGCGRHGAGVRKCSGCSTVAYCGVDCQRQHWRRMHKHDCKELKELRELKPVDAKAAAGAAASNQPHLATSSQASRDGSTQAARSSDRHTSSTSNAEAKPPAESAAAAGNGTPMPAPASASTTATPAAPAFTPGRSGPTPPPIPQSSVSHPEQPMVQLFMTIFEADCTLAQRAIAQAASDGRPAVWHAQQLLLDQACAQVKINRAAKQKLLTWAQDHQVTTLDFMAIARFHGDTRMAVLWMYINHTLARPHFYVLSDKARAEGLNAAWRYIDSQENKLFVNLCGHCGSYRGCTTHCTGCKKVGYCNAQCQKAHWTAQHSKQCRTLHQLSTIVGDPEEGQNPSRGPGIDENLLWMADAAMAATDAQQAKKPRLDILGLKHAPVSTAGAGGSDGAAPAGSSSSTKAAAQGDTAAKDGGKTDSKASSKASSSKSTAAATATDTKRDDTPPKQFPDYFPHELWGAADILHMFQDLSPLAQQAYTAAVADGGHPLWHMRRILLTKAADKLGYDGATVSEALAASKGVGVSKGKRAAALSKLWDVTGEFLLTSALYDYTEAAVVGAMSRAVQGQTLQPVAYLAITCASCGRQLRAVKTCQQCQIVSYCNAQCQKRHGAYSHKVLCPHLQYMKANGMWNTVWPTMVGGTQWLPDQRVTVSTRVKVFGRDSDAASVRSTVEPGGGSGSGGSTEGAVGGSGSGGGPAGLAGSTMTAIQRKKKTSSSDGGVVSAPVSGGGAVTNGGLRQQQSQSAGRVRPAVSEQSGAGVSGSESSPTGKASDAGKAPVTAAAPGSKSGGDGVGSSTQETAHVAATRSKASPFKLSFDPKPAQPKATPLAAQPPPTPPKSSPSPAHARPEPAQPQPEPEHAPVKDPHQLGFDLLYQAAMLWGGELADLAEEAKRQFDELAAEVEQ